MGSYRERLLVPVSYWLLAVPSIAFLGSEAWFVAGGIVPPVTLAVLTLIAALFLLNWGSATVEVTAGVLRAGRDTLPLGEASEVIALDEKQTALLRGARADPAAHQFLRPYVKRAVYIGLADQTEGVPYWLVSTRHPDRLTAAIGHVPAAEGGQGADDRQSVG
ncbi:MAG: DUF3093 domain-containing protein [Trebonia sp.]|jgi:hypothetical protein